MRRPCLSPRRTDYSPEQRANKRNRAAIRICLSRGAGSSARPAQPGAPAMQREISKSKAGILIALSGLAAVISALELHGWHVYLAMGLVGIGLAIGFIRWSKKY